MRVSDYIEQSFSNLWKKKLRTVLTIFGVMIGIGALVSMFSFGQGIQDNITNTFNELQLFNYVSIYPRSENNQKIPHSEDPNTPEQAGLYTQILDDEFIRDVTEIEGVESAFPEVRFPAMIRFNEQEKFSLVQVLPADICQSGLMKLRAGRPYSPDDSNALIISDSLLRRMKVREPEAVIGQEIEISTLTVDLSLSNIPNIISFLRGKGLPFSRQSYQFTIVGVTGQMGFAGPMPVRSDVFIMPAESENMNKLSLTSIWDLFQSSQQAKGYSMVNIKLSSTKYIEPVKAQMEDLGFRTFALIDHLEEIQTGFIFMNMFLFAVGMIAITVAALGIINTMVMSILERYKEIGIMKAVGASDGDVKKIFFFESGAIGFLGGVLGLILGWLVSIIINQIINYFMAKQGVPYMDYFSFRWWLVSGAIVFSVLISLAAGVYPTIRAARVDPVVALRHD
jgi:putative ABC transport system permease protein